MFRTSGPPSRYELANSSEFADFTEDEWKGAASTLSHTLADERDHTLLLTVLLRQAREYVADALEAYEHSDGRELLTMIDAALPAENGAVERSPAGASAPLSNG